MISHIQATCGGIHALNVLALQNEMQRYHLNSNGILEYINEPEDDQAKIKRANRSITDTTLVIIAINVMLSTKKSPRANEDWEELEVAQRTWARWKPTYCAATKKSVIKKKAAGGKDQFEATHSATPPLIASAPMGGDNEGTPIGLSALDGYFDNIAADATNEESVLDELVTNLITLTTRNAEMAATIKKITGKNR